MSGGTSTTSQRLRLEACSTRAVYELLGLPVPAAVVAALAVAASPGPPTKRSRPAVSSDPTATTGAGVGGKFALLDQALRQFYDKLPYNHGAQLCIEDLLSHVRKLTVPQPPAEKQDLKTAPSGAGGVGKKTTLAAAKMQDALVQGTIEYLHHPGFVDHLAAFGKLPNHPYILTFDPYAYQCKPPPSEEESREFDPVAFAECANGGSSNTMMPSKADLEALDKELEQIFDEKLPIGRIRCPKCKESKFMHFHEEQRRSADEGSSYVYVCANCGQSGRSR
jgi:DNA-directed RNA polymerase subunit M/transcription elongation factor TFIIS